MPQKSPMYRRFWGILGPLSHNARAELWSQSAPWVPHLLPGVQDTREISQICLLSARQLWLVFINLFAYFFRNIWQQYYSCLLLKLQMSCVYIDARNEKPRLIFLLETDSFAKVWISQNNDQKLAVLGNAGLLLMPISPEPRMLETYRFLCCKVEL